MRVAFTGSIEQISSEEYYRRKRTAEGANSDHLHLVNGYVRKLANGLFFPELNAELVDEVGDSYFLTTEHPDIPGMSFDVRSYSVPSLMKSHFLGVDHWDFMSQWQNYMGLPHGHFLTAEMMMIQPVDPKWVAKFDADFQTIAVNGDEEYFTTYSKGMDPEFDFGQMYTQVRDGVAQAYSVGAGMLFL